MRSAKWIVLLAGFAAIAGAAPQEDSADVAVDLNGAVLLHRTPVSYPAGARGKNLAASVAVEVSLDASGAVTDARVLSGPEEFRRNVLQSVLQWHFAHESAGMRRQVIVSFVPQPLPPPAAPDPKLEEVRRTIESMRAKEAAIPRTVSAIHIEGLSEPTRAKLLGKLTVHKGDTLDVAGRERIEKAVRDFDEHLTVLFGRGDSMSQVEVRIAVANARQETPALPGRIRVGGNIAQSKLVSQTRPAYPPEAKQQRIQGSVHLAAVIGKDGAIQQLELISGHPLLAEAAIEAVRQWVYQPTLLNGNAVEVATQIDVNFTLSQ